MKDTDHILLRGACTKLLFHINNRIENEWMGPNERDKLEWKEDRLEAFREYVKLDRRFGR